MSGQEETPAASAARDSAVALDTAAEARVVRDEDALDVPALDAWLRVVVPAAGKRSPPASRRSGSSPAVRPT